MRPNFDYHYGQESDQYTFYKIPKTLMEDSRFEKMSLASKILYSMMLSRMELSQKNQWLDAENRVYIYFSIEEVMKILCCGKEKAVRLLAELDKDYGLIERRRQGQGKPSIIYVKHFARPLSDCKPKENPEVGNGNLLKFDNQTSRGSVGEADLKKSEKQTYASSESSIQEVPKSNRKYNDLKYPEFSYNKSIISTHQDEGAMDSIDGLKEKICQRIEYNTLRLQFPQDELDGIVEIMLEVALSKGDTMRIGDKTLNIEYVKKRFEDLGQFHIEYVMECMAENTTNVRNIKAYLISALFNAPATIEHFYKSKVNHDFAADTG